MKTIFDIQNVINGVVTGITIVFLLGVYDQVVKYIARKKQITQIRIRILKGMERIRNISKRSQHLPASVPWDPDQIRRSSFHNLVDDIQVAFEFQGSEITLNEKEQVFSAIEGALVVLGLREPPPQGPSAVGMKLYEATFDNLHALDWLGLPSK